MVYVWDFQLFFSTKCEVEYFSYLQSLNVHFHVVPCVFCLACKPYRTIRSEIGYRADISGVNSG